MSSLSPPLARPSVLAARRTAFGQIVRNEARLVRRQPTNMMGSIGLPVVLNVVSVVAFGAPVPASPAGLALSCLLAIGGLFALGLLIAALAPTANSVNAIGRLALIPLLFFAGLWLPRALMPAVLLDISNYMPLGAAVEAIQDSIRSGFPPAAPLLVLAAYALVLAFLARRFFRWE